MAIPQCMWKLGCIGQESYVTHLAWRTGSAGRWFTVCGRVVWNSNFFNPVRSWPRGVLKCRGCTAGLTKHMKEFIARKSRTA